MAEMLDFQRRADEAFSFLVRDFGFVVANFGPTYLTFENALVRVVVGFDAGRSFELDVRIGLRGDVANATSEPPYRLAEVLGSKGVPQQERFEAVQITTKSGMETFLWQMAQALKAHGERLIEGDVSAFREVARYRDQECESYRRDQELSRARQAASAAWARKDYVDVVRALSPFSDLLSKVDLQRLEIAKKRMSST